MDDFLWEFMKVFYGTNNISYDHFCLLFWQSFMLFQVVGQIWTLAMLQYRKEGILVNFNSSVVLYDIWVI